MSNKINESEFLAGIEKFLAILQRQPNLLHHQHTNEQQAHSLAEMAVSFSIRYNELKQKHVGQ
ncbi:hypothetical protein [Alcaligenes sp. PF14]|uniref:hypothetical protein n=1 Tax=Alcaligenes sp. PF14 TaxID=3120297 RepID=UPI003016F4F8